MTCSVILGYQEMGLTRRRIVNSIPITTDYSPSFPFPCLHFLSTPIHPSQPLSVLNGFDINNATLLFLYFVFCSHSTLLSLIDTLILFLPIIHSIPSSLLNSSLLTSHKSWISSPILSVEIEYTLPPVIIQELLRIYLIQLCEHHPALSLTILLFTTVLSFSHSNPDQLDTTTSQGQLSVHPEDSIDCCEPDRLSLRPVANQLRRTTSQHSHQQHHLLLRRTLLLTLITRRYSRSPPSCILFPSTNVSLSSYSNANESIKSHSNPSEESLCPPIPLTLYLLVSYQQQIKRILPSSSFVLSTKSRCPCVVDLELQQDGLQSQFSCDCGGFVDGVDSGSIGGVDSGSIGGVDSGSIGGVDSGSIDGVDSGSIDGVDSGSIDDTNTDNSDDINTDNSDDNTHTNTTHHRIIIKTNDFMRQEEMASNLIHEVHIHLSYHSRFNTSSQTHTFTSTFIPTTSSHSTTTTPSSTISRDSSPSINSKREPNPSTYHIQTHQQSDIPLTITTIPSLQTQLHLIHRCILHHLIRTSTQRSQRWKCTLSIPVTIKILIDQLGNVVHIDYGFFLSNSPGNIHFETAPFKLNNDIVLILIHSHTDPTHRNPWILRIPTLSNTLCNHPIHLTLQTQVYDALISHQDRILSIVKLFAIHYPHLPCFSSTLSLSSCHTDDPQRTIQLLTQRLNPQIQTDQFVQQLIQQALGSWTTHLYDSFQFYLTGIY